jgi:titin
MGVTAPSAPRALTIGTVTSTTAALTWTPPSTNGGATIGDYLVETSRDGGTIWNAVPHTASANPKLDVTGLAPGITYLVRVSAKNSAGYSESVSGTFTTLLKVASAPALLSARDVNGTTLTLGWSLPTSNGGAPITDYNVQFSSNGGLTWNSITHEAVNLRTFAVTGLQAGTSYKFRVAPVTSVGLGGWSPIASATTLGYAPKAPTGLTVSSKTTSTITLKWSKALVSGGSAVRSYVIQYSKNNGASWMTVTTKVKLTGLSLVVSGLKTKTTYLFRAIALNDVGSSAPSKTFKVATK